MVFVRIAAQDLHATRSVIKTFLLVSGGAGLLLLPALLNGFPFVFPDTTDYLIFTPRLYRSPFYGLFIFFFHLNTFVWAPVVIQALIVSHLVWLLMRLHWQQVQAAAFIAVIVVLTFATSLPYVVGFLMPDVFASVLILSLYMLGLHWADLSPLERVYLFLLAGVAISAHPSYAPIAFCLVPVIGVAMLVNGLRGKQLALQLGTAAMPVLVALAAAFLYNLTVLRIAALAPAGSSFLLANLIEHGPARSYLQESCAAKSYAICAELDRLPDDANKILWTETYPRLGGFRGMRSESREIVEATIRLRPIEVLQVMLSNMWSALFVRAPAAELGPIAHEEHFAALVEQKFGAAAWEAHKKSLQSQGTFPRFVPRGIDLLVFPLSLLALMLGVGRAIVHWDARGVTFVGVVIAGYALNLVICAAASGVHDRYQSRVSWLLPFAAIVLVVGRAPTRRKTVHAPATARPGACVTA